MWRLLRISSMVLATLAAIPCSVRADLDTEPYLFHSQSVDPTGGFEWDEFTGTYAGPHVPDFDIIDTGSASITSSGELVPGEAPPFGVLTSTQNLYAAGTLATWKIHLADLDHLQPSTTIVLQVASLGPLAEDQFLLDSLEPLEFVEVSVQSDVVHDTDGNRSPFETYTYWAEWQVPAEAAYEIEFSAIGPHTSLAAARLDYFNVSPVYDAAAPGAVIRMTGDLDGDGDVDAADLNSLLVGWTGALDPGAGQRGWTDGDFDSDGDVDSADLNLLIVGWTGAQATDASAAPVDPVPEPATLPLALAGLFVMFRFVRRCRAERT